MKKPNTTPGPWASNADTVWMNRAFQAVCSPYHHPQSVANARAVAAVPDLLAFAEACQDADTLTEQELRSMVYHLSRAALTKAGYTF